jgi:hypothetical protein
MIYTDIFTGIHHLEKHLVLGYPALEKSLAILAANSHEFANANQNTNMTWQVSF